MDKISEDRIAQLHPAIRAAALQIFHECEAALTGRAHIRIAQGLRTIDEQNALYAQGRTKPGNIVTNARGGSSYHNYGLAVDFVLVIDGTQASWDMSKDWDTDKVADWIEVVKIFKKYGWEWGGNWTSIKDYPHFQKTFGNTIKSLLKKYKAGDFIPGTQYINL